jgi:lipopolysaccharide transport system ATP-binding protein
MSKIAIKAENISKQYRLGEIGTGTISHDLNRWWHKVRGKEDPFLKIGESNDRTQKGETDYVWSLKDINFEINQGDAVGIIGRNGAGKSTLLKLLSKVTKPSTGQFKINGRIASLLEVGTGFHPEMTGRENIYLNGAILGMRRSEITRKFDEIVDFAGIERYIDTPVKRYSSGMYVRLAFAVAAHLESEILIVDEVLAVGDAEFQKKCLGKMNQVATSHGRTVLFVSHNIQAIKQICNKSLLLQNGRIKIIGDTSSVIDNYYHFSVNKTYSISTYKLESHFLLINKVEIVANSELIYTNSEFVIKMHMESREDSLRPGITLILKDQFDTIICSSINNNDKLFRKARKKNENFEFQCEIPKNLLNNLVYKISLIVFKDNYLDSKLFEDVLAFEVSDSDEIRGDYSSDYSGVIRPLLKWKTI